jgi:tetratricopeptide (TPR) repeat protein
MNVVDLHPEQFFDALREGRLAASDRARLEAHCAHCAACRFELRWLESEPVAPPPSAEDHAYGEAALSAVLRMPEAPRPSLATRASSWPLQLGVAGLTLAVSVGLVLYLGRPNAAAPILVPQAEAPVSEPARAETPVQVAPAPQPLVRESPPPVAATPSANALLASARRAHTRGQIERAHKLYRQVIDTYAASAAAGTAEVALGRLLYEDKQQPAAALVELDRYLKQKPSGALVEEALFYKALSYERLGDAEQAATALRQLLRVYPQSIYATAARARLGRARTQ